MGESLLPSGFIEARKLSGSDFAVYAGPMKPMKIDALPIEDQNKPILEMRGSSTIEDLQGDIMSINALQSMTNVPPNLTLWLNHSYQVPFDALGKLFGSPRIDMQKHVSDLWIASEVFLDNPAAEKTYSLITKNGARFGCSIGCMVTKWSFANPDDPYSSAINIDEVYTLEWSVVGIPCVQRCWVENAIKGLFTRSLIEGNAEQARALAPAYKGLFTKNYDEIVRNVTSIGLRKDLERTPMRNASARHIVYDFTDGTEGFALRDRANTIAKKLSHEEISSIMAKSLAIVEEIAEVNEDDKSLETKSVSGKTSWPLMDIGTSWDGGKATKQIFDWARDDNGDIIASKAKQCHLYYNPDETDTQAGYKMPFCFISSGSPQIVPLGIRAIAGILQGSMGGIDASDADKNGMRAKVKTIYGRINSQFHPDPAWVVPWEKDDSNKSIADSNSDAPLNRQDITEEGDMPKGKKKADDVEVSADGTHAPMTGTHTHAHKAFGSQGEDDQHSHSHSHDNDANHDHAHDDSEGSNGDAEKGLEPAITKSSSETPIQTENAQIVTTEPNSDTPAQDVSSENEAPATIVKSDEPQETDHRLVLLRSIATQLGLPESVITSAPIATKTIVSQDVITCISNIDNLADALDDQVDMLMDYFNIPDIDDDEPTDSPGYTRYSLETRLERALAGIMRTKEGREISAKNRDNLQTIHDCVKAMHPGCCAGVQSETVDEATDNAREQGEGRPLQEQYSFAIAESLKSIDGLTKSLADINIKSVVQSEVNAALEEARKKLLAINSDQQTLMDNIRKLKEMPLGRPTTLAGRRTVVQEDTATYHDLLTAGVKPLESLTEDDLEVVEKGSMRMKLWPAGFKAGQRPPLTESQKMYMSPLDYYPYEQALRDVCVPILEEQRA